MYRVIKYFTDLQDKDHPYSVGDTFPREGITVTEKRLAELAGSNNKQETPLIERVESEQVKAPAKKSVARKPAARKAGAKTSAK